MVAGEWWWLVVVMKVVVIGQWWLVFSVLKVSAIVLMVSKPVDSLTDSSSLKLLCNLLDNGNLKFAFILASPWFFSLLKKARQNW